MILSRLFHRSEVSSTRRPMARRKPAIEALEGRQLLSTLTFSKVEMNAAQVGSSVADSIRGSHIGYDGIQGAHIGSAMIQGAHIGSAMIVGQHIGYEAIQGQHIGYEAIQGAHIGYQAIQGQHIGSPMIVGNHAGTNFMALGRKH
jgi:hypothetical protein